MTKYICIHGHFYQPPRENPWLETVELQDSAAPFHDWNERITAECYARNTTARIFNHEVKIESIVNNYSKISFNFGPTLLTWMKDKLPAVHEAIVEADRLSQEKFSGHGSAIAQVYNHMILPLANARDKQTQVIWGIRDFESRFRRKPEGMWLSETAADTETLEALASHGIKYTILSPFQASRMREIGKRNWRDVNGGRIDPTRPYLVHLPSGRTISIFFYDAPVSQAVAFEKLLDSGERFAHRLLGAFSDQRNWDQLVHIATDGESYGHHHRWGEMALAYSLKYIEENNLARLTNYGEFLEKHPPTHEAQIHEKSAWSCSHGVGRWMENCGCNSGGHGGWHQNWRAPLRHALDWLRDQISPVFQAHAAKYLKDPWAARDDYISVMLDRSDENLERFLDAHATRPLSEADKIAILKLMELQRHAMLMYTSCGWFFDELSGIETVQVIQYAARAIQLAQDVLQQDFESGFLDLLAGAKSNIGEHSDGRRIYEKFVKPARIDWPHAVAHYAVSSVFQNYGERTRIFLYEFEEQARKMQTAGRARLAFGTVKASFTVTRESHVLSYAALYLGEHNLTGGVKAFATPEEYDRMATELTTSFDRADFPETIRLIDRHFGSSSYSLRSLFKDEQRRILQEILGSTNEDLENRFRLIAERYTPLMRFLRDLGAPLPQPLQTAADFILHVDIRRHFENESTNFELLRDLLEQAKGRPEVVLDAEINFAMKQKMERLMVQLEENPADAAALDQACETAAVAKELPFDPNFWKVRNVYWKLLQSALPDMRARASAGEEEARKWVGQFMTLGDRLGFAARGLEQEPAQAVAA